MPSAHCPESPSRCRSEKDDWNWRERALRMGFSTKRRQAGGVARAGRRDLRSLPSIANAVARTPACRSPRCPSLTMTPSVQRRLWVGKLEITFWKWPAAVGAGSQLRGETTAHSDTPSREGRVALNMRARQGSSLNCVSIETRLGGLMASDGSSPREPYPARRCSNRFREDRGWRGAFGPQSQGGWQTKPCRLLRWPAPGSGRRSC